MFQVPPPTRFDLRFSIAGIPVRVHPLFWLIAILFGANNNIYGMLIWVVVIFVSILVHELGHAFAFRRFGQSSSIILHITGGLTVPESLPWSGGYASVSLTPNQHIFVSLAGPLSGFGLAVLAYAIGLAAGGEIIMTSLFGFIPFPLVLLPYGTGVINQFLVDFLWVNIFWGLINLMPVYPLDGGNISRYTLIQQDPLGGLRTSLWISVGTGTVLAVVGFLVLNSIYMAFLFGLLAFQSLQMIQGIAGRY